MYKGPIVDAHHHIWEVKNYPWLMAPPTPKVFGNYDPLRQDYMPETFVADVSPSGVTKSVHIQANWDPSNPVGETAWLQGVADRLGFPHGIIAYANLTKAEEAETLIKGHMRYANIRGIRHQVYWYDEPLWRSCERPDLVATAEFMAGFKLLKKYGLRFELQMFPFHDRQLASSEELLRENPDTAVILVHAGMLPLGRQEFVAPWRKGLERLARHPNLWVKISGLALLSHKWSKEDLRQVIKDVVAIFGPQRCIWGSNFPLERMWASYADLLGVVREVLAEEFSEDDQRNILYDNALKFYNI